MFKKESNNSLKDGIPNIVKPIKEKEKTKDDLFLKNYTFKKESNKIQEPNDNSLFDKKPLSENKQEKLFIGPSLIKSQKQRDYVSIVIVILLMGLIIFFLYNILYPYLEKQDRYLEVGENVDTAVVIADSSLVVRLKEFNSNEVSSVKLVLNGDGEYYHEPKDVKQDYAFSLLDLGLANFDYIVKVSAILTYNTEPFPLLNGTDPLTNQNKSPTCNDKLKNGNETGIDCGGNCKSCGGGGGGGGGGGTTPPGCSPSRDCSYYSNLGQCGVSLSDGCSNSLNCLTCNNESYCYTGEGISNICINNSFRCNDSDGKDYFINGNVTVNNSNLITFRADSCSSNLTEFFCYFNGSVFEAQNESYKCPYRCNDGKCERVLCTHEDNCTALNLLKIDSCTNTPDGNSFTLDFRPNFLSKCLNGECTYGDITVSSKCIKGNCSAVCNNGENFSSTDLYCLSNDLYKYVYECNTSCGFADLNSANNIFVDNCVRNCKASGCNLTTKKNVTYNESYDSCKNKACVEPDFCNSPVSSVCEIDCGASCEAGTCGELKVCDSITCMCVDKQCTRHSDCGAGAYCDSSGVCQARVGQGGDCSGVTYPVYAGQSTDSVCLGYCRTDYDSGKFCVTSSSSCTHDAIVYTTGTRAPDCYSTTNERTCSGGSWISGTTCPSIPKIETCTNNPDGNKFTFDYRPFFQSVCISGTCTEGTTAVISSCVKDSCSAECNDGETYSSSDLYCSSNNLYNYVYECNSTCGFYDLNTANNGLVDNCVRTCSPDGCYGNKYNDYGSSSDSCIGNECFESVGCTTPLSSRCEIDCGASCEAGTCGELKVCSPSTCTCIDKQCTRHSDCPSGYCNSAGVCKSKLLEGSDCGGVVNPVYSGESADEVCLGFCRSDYDSGKFCVSVSSSCTHGSTTGTAYVNGARAPDCYSSANEHKCLDGSWVLGTTCPSIPKVETCSNNPDGNKFTFDYRPFFQSVCISGTCTEGTTAVISSCVKDSCSAECNDGETYSSSDLYCSSNNLYNYVYECNSTCGFDDLNTANNLIVDNCVRTCSPDGCYVKKYNDYGSSSDSCIGNECFEPVGCTTPLSSRCEIDCGASCEEGTCIGLKVCSPSTCTCVDKQCTRHSDCGAGAYCDSSGVCQARVGEGLDCSGVSYPVYPGQSNNYVCLGYCRGDYDDGRFCVTSSTSCTHDSVAYTNGARAPDCITSPLSERRCSSGSWIAGTSCDDSVGCTDDTCSGALGCQHTTNNARCDDGDVCTGAETCSATLDCVLGTALTCNDVFACTINSCDKLIGCQYTPNNALCSDSVDCTDDTCSALDGCHNTLNDGRCSLGFSCTSFGCVQTSCSGCTNCNNWFGEGCDYDKCHTECNKNGLCYFDEDLLVDENCDYLSSMCSKINFCADYSISECESDPCGKSLTGCMMSGETCVVAPVCWNDIIEIGEVCDKSKLGGKSCSSFFTNGEGTLSCCPDCSKFDLSSCEEKIYTSCTKEGGEDIYDRDSITSDYSTNSGPDCEGEIPPGGGGGTETKTDFCFEDRYLVEYYCGGDNSIQSRTYDCYNYDKRCPDGVGRCKYGLGTLSWFEGLKQFLRF